MRRIETCKRIIYDQRGNAHSVSYYITVEDAEGKPGQVFFENYGLGITSEHWGCSEIKSITVCRDKIELLAMLAAANDVTPAGLADVVDEWLKL